MPPCKAVLLNKIRRTNAISRMFKQSALNDIQLPSVDEGWTLDEGGGFCIQYLDGELFPSDILELDLEMTSDASDISEFDYSDSDEESF